jgi:hypothetical protein
MSTMPTMPKAVERNVARATRCEKVQQHNRNPMSVADKGDPRQGGSTLRMTRPAAATPLSSTERPATLSRGSGLSIETALVGVGFFVAFVLVTLFGVDLACAWPLAPTAVVRSMATVLARGCHAPSSEAKSHTTGSAAKVVHTHRQSCGTKQQIAGWTFILLVRHQRMLRRVRMVSKASIFIFLQGE